jgi:hypothetical protein
VRPPPKRQPQTRIDRPSGELICYPFFARRSVFFSFGTQADIWLGVRNKLFPSMVASQSSTPVLPPVQGVPAFPSHIGRLSTFWVSVTTYGGLRNALGNDPDLESLQIQVPDLLRTAGEARSGLASCGGGVPSTLSSADEGTALQTPKADGSWEEKDEKHSTGGTVLAPSPASLSDTSTSDDTTPLDRETGEP